MENNIYEVRFAQQISTMSGESRTIEGYAIRFNSESEILVDKEHGAFTEVIKPEAVTQVTINNSDVVATFQHQGNSIILARSKNGKGTLKLNVDTQGLYYRFNAPNTSNGNEVLDAVKRGDITGSSFRFAIANGGETMERRSNKVPLRTITKIAELKDVCPVIEPAYEMSSAYAVRSLEMIKHSELIEKEFETRSKELNDLNLKFYYSQLENEINNLINK